MDRRDFLGVLGANACAAAAQQPRPNIVFILIDDLRWDALGYTGHPFARTPHIDRIAREGVNFRNAFVTTPLCSPSRASFLTGQYVHTHGVRDNSDHSALSHELLTFPRLLRETGYETAYVGKWHMGTDDTPRPGFDRWVSFRGQGRYDDPPLNVDGKPVPAQGYMTDLLSEHAVEFIRRPRTKPFALYLAHKAVHGPFTPAERHKDLFADRPVPRSPNTKDTLESKPVLRREIEGVPRLGPGTGSGDELIRNQLRCMSSVDEGVGRIFEALEQTRQLDNTLIVFTSDNGYLWGEHGLGDKRFAYEESIRIPLAMRWPRLIKPDWVVEQFALNIDLAPTLLEVAGAPVPKPMQGRSLVPVLRGKPAGWRRSFLTEYFAEPRYPRVPTWQAVRSERWKYVEYTALRGMDELYELKSDPYEMNNLIGEPAARRVLVECKQELGSLRKETGQ